VENDQVSSIDLSVSECRAGRVNQVIVRNVASPHQYDDLRPQIVSRLIVTDCSYLYHLEVGR
jgi:hypothetical protein